MENQSKTMHGKRTIVLSVLCCILAFVCAWGIVLYQLGHTMENSGNAALVSFTAIMDGYVHSFELYEVTLQQEIAYAKDADEISACLKKNDAKFSQIEGEDYDGVYMYYNGQYLYSWDTPLSQYENSGYDATARPWYTGAMAAKGNIYFSVPYRSYANDYMLATISRLQPDGKTVIAYDIKLGTIRSFTEHLDLYQGSLTLLCDEAGNIIGSTDPRYEGGNYNFSDEDYAKLLAQARADAESAAPGAEQKATQAVANLQMQHAFITKNDSAVRTALAAPSGVHFSVASGSFVYALCNDTYDCITFVPFIKALPAVLIIWLVLSAVLLLGLLLRQNVSVRIAHAKDLEIKNLELAEAVKKADAASVAKSQFLAQMSHEIRTPMNAVIGLTDIAKTEVRSPEKVTDCLTKIEGSSRLLLSIINDVLDMSAIEGGKLQIDSSEFDFKALISNITTVFYEQVRQKSISFEVRMAGITAERMIGDALRVNQVLMNLLSNAVKFTPPGGQIVLHILQSSRSQDKIQLRFQVSDTGCGMSEEMQRRLFKPFEQESASTARKHGGSGLGLSITKRLVEMMGGSIQVKSAQGKGSVFTADIPFHLPADADMPTTVCDFSKIRALVVDDSAEAREYCSVLLQRLGVRYEVASDGEAALEALENAEDQNDAFTLCLIDWRMPGMDGVQLSQKIHDIFGDDALIIIISAYDLNEVEAAGSSAGVQYFIPKPLFQSTLFNALMQISGGGVPHAEAEKAKSDYNFSGKHVLIAEDVALNMEVAVKLLSLVGIEATCAEDGRQAVDIFSASKLGQFDCLLLDINMPVMDGYEAARAIRALNRPDAATVPIYAMTANAFAEDVTAALDAGMNGHIAKPIETKVLYRTLDTAFQTRQNAKAPPAESERTK